MNDMMEPTPIEEEPVSPDSTTPRQNDHFFGRLADVVVKPGRLMANVAEAPRWWQAGLLIFITTMVVSWFVLPIALPEGMEFKRDSLLYRMQPEGAWEEQYQAFLNIGSGQRAFMAVGSAFQIWISLLIMGTVLGFFGKMSGGKGAMKQALGIVHWGSLIPLCYAAILKCPLILVVESAYQVNFGLVALLRGLEPDSILFSVLAFYGDFFAWWGIFVLVVGFSRVFGLTKGAASVSVILPWVLLTAVFVASSAI